MAKVDTLVDRIAVRTPHWEVTLDGAFSQDDREQIFDHISQKLIPNETIEEFTETIDDLALAQKIVSASRRIVRRSWCRLTRRCTGARLCFGFSMSNPSFTLTGCSMVKSVGPRAR